MKQVRCDKNVFFFIIFFFYVLWQAVDVAIRDATTFSTSRQQSCLAPNWRLEKIFEIESASTHHKQTQKDKSQCISRYVDWQEIESKDVATRPRGKRKVSRVTHAPVSKCRWPQSNVQRHLCLGCRGERYSFSIFRAIDIQLICLSFLQEYILCFNTNAVISTSIRFDCEDVRWNSMCWHWYFDILFISKDVITALLQCFIHAFHSCLPYCQFYFLCSR